MKCIKGSGGGDCIDCRRGGATVDAAADVVRGLDGRMVMKQVLR